MPPAVWSRSPSPAANSSASKIRQGTAPLPGGAVFLYKIAVMTSFYLRPLGLSAEGEAAPLAPSLSRSLAGGPLWFSNAEAILRDPGAEARRRSLPVEEALAWAEEALGAAPVAALSEALTRPRPDFAGLTLDRARIMGVVNVTPDSFSDGGDRFDTGLAVAAGLELQEAGADILDIGGESTRPGADPVAPAEERRRVIPVIRELARQGALVSVDTRHAATMAEALAAGAAIVNDVTALSGDPESLGVVAEAGCALVLMHMQGAPETMQTAPRYEEVVLDIYDYLAARLEACLVAGISPDRVAVDPGIGFGKTIDHNLQILDQLALYHGLGCPLLLGVSRKSFIGRLSTGEAPKDRLPGSLAAALAGLARGAQILRVHDVAETRQAIRIWEAIASQRQRPLAAE